MQPMRWRTQCGGWPMQPMCWRTQCGGWPMQPVCWRTQCCGCPCFAIEGRKGDREGQAGRKWRAGRGREEELHVRMYLK
eukprot:359314-Chlamydomonas_euryale.AAC.1